MKHKNRQSDTGPENITGLGSQMKISDKKRKTNGLAKPAGEKEDAMPPIQYPEMNPQNVR